MLSKCRDELSENELKADELSGSDCRQLCFIFEHNLDFKSCKDKRAKTSQMLSEAVAWGQIVCGNSINPLYPNLEFRKGRMN